MDPFARYPSCTYTTMQDGLIVELIARKVGRNGWAVMAALCHRVYSDGKLGRVSAEELSRSFKLTPRQVAHGMEELRSKGVIVPVVRKRADGVLVPDRSRFGNVAQYCISKDVWSSVELKPADS
jgi:hypothetical protein